MTMPGIQEQMERLYKRNLAWFRAHRPDLHKLLASAPARPEYSLVLRENRYLDIGHRATRNLVYRQDPEERAQQSFARIVDSPGNFLDFQRAPEAAGHAFPPIEALNEIDRYIAAHKPAEKKRGAPRKIIFFGIGLGHHIRKCADLDGLQSLLLIEPNAEFFRFSLSFVDYGRLAEGRQLFFCIAEDPYQSFFDFMSDQSEYNFSIKLDLLLADYRYLADKIQHYITNRFDFQVEQRLAIANNLIHNSMHFRQLELPDNPPALDVPALVLASGPSLEANLALVRKLQGRVVICSVGSCLKRLLQEDIHVDLCFSLDPKPRIAEQFRDIEPQRLGRTVFITSTQSDIAVTDILNQPLVLDVARLNTPTVAHLALLAACRLGFRTIYTIGIDAALSDRLREYSSDVVAPPPDEQAAAATFPVKGNLRDTVTTNEKLWMYVGAYERMAHEFTQVRIFNLSDGARVEGLIPCDPGSLDAAALPRDNAAALSRLQELLGDSRVKPWPLEPAVARCEKVSAVLEKHRSWLDRHRPIATTIDGYLATRADVLLRPLAEACETGDLLGTMIRKYLFVADAVLFQFLDNRCLPEPARHIQHLHTCLLNGLVEINERYRGYLQKARLA